ncbi:MAG: NUDIX hydrolase [Anaerolineae bacterium]|nr:NUDIX hydrolase [Anaerolineae bacterium]MCB0202588.1 NUDIX hydrolase [Anaerolineae bacterium]MCB0205856.1 NUDIX hydrolase [Anaerolineae bacterium]MCB0255370.1 NUDIX hydrolase [Anaerolineae bacterium]
MVPRFCVQCGQMLQERRLQGDHRVRRVCPACGHVAYENAKPCAGVLPTRDGQVLLARRAVEPYLGRWDIIGGFLEHDETPDAAATREAFEETGLTLVLLDLLGIYTDVYGSNGYSTLNIYYIARITAGQPNPADDVVELAWFHPDTLPDAMAFPNHTHHVLSDWARWLRSSATVQQSRKRL